MIHSTLLANNLTEESATQRRRRYGLQRVVCEIDALLAAQLDVILHHPTFQQLEASWRSLYALVCIAQDPLQHSALANSNLIQIKMLSISWREVGRDLEHVNDPEQSELFKLIYSHGLDMPGANPFSVLVGDYKISHGFQTHRMVDDTATLSGLSYIASAALCPFITGVDKRLFDVTSMQAITIEPQRLEKLFNGPSHSDWRQLRQEENTRFLGLTFPDILLRSPYILDGDGGRLRYRETTHQAENDYLWGNSAYAYASTLMKTFAETGWFVNLSKGLSEVFYEADHDAPVDQRLQHYLPFGMDPYCVAPRATTSVQLDTHTERTLAQLGFIPLSSRHSQQDSRFYYSPSVNQPKEYMDGIATTNARMTACLAYTFGASRIAHHLKVYGRSRIGSDTTSSTIQRDISQYLHHYTTRNVEGLSAERLKKPLANYRVTVQRRLGVSGSYSSVIHLQPHGQCDQVMGEIRLATSTRMAENNVTGITQE
ncbi:MAG: type VI secretion system contractile sheath large subunit [Limnobacter sp.]|nr:type VI secretion system contractile sheath large subunit [Limnobacter sp.]